MQRTSSGVLFALILADDYAIGDSCRLYNGHSRTPVPTIISKLIALSHNVCYNKTRKAVGFMKKAKKYIYPLLFSIGFLIPWILLVITINATFNDDGYGGLVLGLLILFAWLIFGLPICCIRYSKIIIDEKLKFLFCAYNSLMIIVFHMLPFNLQGQTTIIVLFILWVLFWNIVPLICRLKSPKHEENDIEN